MRKVLKIIRDIPKHWVGDGFPVRTLFSYSRPEEISPFLLLDYAGPEAFAPAKKSRGVQQHPHRGFETVTIVYRGELEHKDTAGNQGRIGPGDVQWMTAARGILHEEMHSQAFTEKGGVLEMVQLWVNLPAKDKMSEPKYQEILNRNIPVVSLDKEAGSLRIIAGNFRGSKGPASTFTPIHLWDIQLKSGHKLNLPLGDGFSTSLLVRKGDIMINGSEAIKTSELVIFDPKGTEITLEANEDTEALLVSGQPIQEPVAGQGPFVMNTKDEIQQAFADFQANRF